MHEYNHEFKITIKYENRYIITEDKHITLIAKEFSGYFNCSFHKMKTYLYQCEFALWERHRVHFKQSNEYQTILLF